MRSVTAICLVRFQVAYRAEVFLGTDPQGWSGVLLRFSRCSRRVTGRLSSEEARPPYWIPSGNTSWRVLRWVLARHHHCHDPASGLSCRGRVSRRVRVCSGARHAWSRIGDLRPTERIWPPRLMRRVFCLRVMERMRERLRDLVGHLVHSEGTRSSRLPEHSCELHSMIRLKLQHHWASRHPRSQRLQLIASC